MKPLTDKRIIERELEGFGIRLNKKPPTLSLKKKDKGGIAITNAMNVTRSKMTDDTVKSILSEYRISNADVTFRSDSTIDELIDVIEGNRIYVPCIYVINKIDAISIEELELLSQVPHYVPISAKDEWNFDELMQKIWTYLDLIRIYTKPKGQIPDYDAPVIMPRTKCHVADFCQKLHKHLIKELRFAQVWGTSAKHNPQKVGKDHQLHDEDVVQIVKKM